MRLIKRHLRELLTTGLPVVAATLSVSLISSCGNSVDPRDRRSSPVNDSIPTPPIDPLLPVNPDPEDTCVAGEPTNFKVTYAHDIKPIISQQCLSCHNGAGAAGGWDLSSYALPNPAKLSTDKAWKKAIATVESGAMPLGRKMLPEDLVKLKQWRDLGLPQTNVDKCDEDPVTLAASILPVCDTKDVKPAPRRIWRLTHSQYGNTTRSLLGVDHDLEKSFVGDPTLYGFDNFSDVLRVDSSQVERYREAATSLATSAAAGLVALRSRFDPTNKGVAEFIKNFGRVLYRKPLSTRQIDDLVAIHTLGVQQNVGYKLLLEAMLQSPFFIYRTELGGPEQGTSGVVELTQHEIASIIAFTATDEGPNEALLDLADKNGLATTEGRMAAVNELLKRPEARRPLKRFFGMLLDTSKVEDQRKDAAVFPTFSTDLAVDMQIEVEKIIDHVLVDKKGSLEELFAGSTFFPNARLAAIYGAPAPAGGDFTKSTRPDRVGILNTAAFLTVSSNAIDSNPFHRGKLIRERLLCTPLGSPPANIPLLSDTPDVGFDTRRDRFAAHSKNPSCRGCHNLIDDIGFSFDGFDAIGRTQLEIDDRPVVTAGHLKNVIDGDSTIQDSNALGTQLAEGEHMKQCVTLQLYRYAGGREETKQDSCSIRNTYKQFSRQKFNLIALLASIMADERRYVRSTKD